MSLCWSVKNVAKYFSSLIAFYIFWKGTKVKLFTFEFKEICPFFGSYNMHFYALTFKISDKCE